MNNSDFEVVFNTQVDICRRTLIQKNEDYARGGDKLSNFKSAAGLQRCTPEKALQGMMAKHQVSINDLIDDLDRGIFHPMPVWNEKIQDALNYLFLLKALLLERASKQN